VVRVKRGGYCYDAQRVVSVPGHGHDHGHGHGHCVQVVIGACHPHLLLVGCCGGLHMTIESRGGTYIEKKNNATTNILSRDG
jgi:hypothetical protein